MRTTDGEATPVTTCGVPVLVDAMTPVPRLEAVVAAQMGPVTLMMQTPHGPR